MADFQKVAEPLYSQASEGQASIETANVLLTEGRHDHLVTESRISHSDKNTCALDGTLSTITLTEFNQCDKTVEGQDLNVSFDLGLACVNIRQSHSKGRPSALNKSAKWQIMAAVSSTISLSMTAATPRLGWNFYVWLPSGHHCYGEYMIDIVVSTIAAR